MPTSITFITISYLEGFLALLFPPPLVLIASSAHLSPHSKKIKKKKKHMQDSTLKLTSHFYFGLKY